MTRTELFFCKTVFPPCGLSCLHFYREWNVQPLWKVEGLEQYTSWKVRVPDCVFFVRNMNSDMCIYTYTYTLMHTYIFKNTAQKHVRVRGWVVGVVWCGCGVVWCVDVVVSLSLVFSNLNLVRSKGVASGEPLKHLITPCGKFW